MLCFFHKHEHKVQPFYTGYCARFGIEHQRNFTKNKKKGQQKEVQPLAINERLP